MNLLNVETLKQELDDLTCQEESLDEDDQERFDFLTKLFDELGKDKPDVLISEDDWTEYARSEVGDYIQGLPMALTHCIDWEKWADALRSDYTKFEVDGTTYLYQT